MLIKNKLILLTILVLNIFLMKHTKCNILGTPYFNFPIMPTNVTYFNFPPVIYPGTFWRFRFRGTYVSWYYPAPKRFLDPQVLFLDNNNIINQRFYIPNGTVALKVTVFYRMPFNSTNGTVRISLDNVILMNLTYRATPMNLNLNEENYIVNTRFNRVLYIRGLNFPNVENWILNRNGFQILSVYVEIVDEEDYFEDKKKKSSERFKSFLKKKFSEKKSTATAEKVVASTSTSAQTNN